LILQALHGFEVNGILNFLDMLPRIIRQILSFGNESSDSLDSVLYGALFPGMVRIAKVNLDSQFLLPQPVTKILSSPVCGDGNPDSFG
jgi:hypothetical protein